MLTFLFFFNLFIIDIHSAIFDIFLFIFYHINIFETSSIQIGKIYLNKFILFFYLLLLKNLRKI